MQKETLFKLNVRPKLDAIPKSWWVKTQMLATCGIPDFLGVIKGIFVAIELKKDRYSKPSKLQLYVLEKIKSAGGRVYVAHPQNFDKILAELKEI